MCVFICALSFAGATHTLHLPGNRVHQHSDHIQCNSQGGHCASSHAYTEILLLGCQPSGPQWNHSQRPWWEHAHNGKIYYEYTVWYMVPYSTLHCYTVSIPALLEVINQNENNGSSTHFFDSFFSLSCSCISHFQQPLFAVFSDGPRPNQKEILSLRAFLLLFVKQLIMKVS